MGNILKAFLYNRYVIRTVSSFVEYLALDLLYAGGTIFGYLERSYIRGFDKSERMAVTKNGTDQTVDWENSAIVGRNRRYAHAILRSFPTTNDAIEYWNSPASEKKKESPNVIYLTNTIYREVDDPHWNFLLVGSPEVSPTDWFLLDGPTSDLNWVLLSLPGHWQLQGFDIPIYTNTAYPFQFDPPRVRRTGKWKVTDCDAGLGGTTATSGTLHPKEPGENSTGLYKRSFTLPIKWTNPDESRVFIVFEGVDSCLSLWVNGRYVGYSQDSCLPAEFDITDFLSREGTVESYNFIAVQVSRWCDGSYVEDQDKWWLSGIYREVYLIRKPATFICDYEFISDVRTLTKGEGENATEEIVAGITVNVLVEVSAPARSSASETHAVRAELREYGSNAASETVLTICSELSESSGALPLRAVADQMVPAHSADVALVPPTSAVQCTLHAPVNNPKLWTAETPNLYVLVLSLHETLDDARSGINPIDVESIRIGLRDVQIFGQDNVLCVNEKPLVIAGVNRHEFEPRSGRTTSEEIMRRDAALLKQLNFNAVRCSHYPPHPRWFEICDEAGLYVIDEANIESHGFQCLGQAVGYLSHRPEWYGALLSRVTRMVERDKNATCVIGWSLGNESGVGPAHEAMHTWVRARDPRRFVQYESGGACSTVTDIICPMYQRPAWCRRHAKFDPLENPTAGRLARPVILCEYAHAMGNSGGCLRRYWRDFRDPAFPRLQGGFIWDWIDQGLLLPNAQGYGYGGDFGDIPNTKQFCINGILGPDRQPHPSAWEAAAWQSDVSFALAVYSSFFEKDEVQLREASGESVKEKTEEELKAERVAKHNARMKDYIEEVPRKEVQSTGKYRNESAKGFQNSKGDPKNTKKDEKSVAEQEAPADSYKLSIVVFNTRIHTSLANVSISVTLYCDVMDPAQGRTPAGATVVLTTPFSAVLPGETKSLAVASIFPFLAPSKSLGRGSPGLLALEKALGIAQPSLGRIWEAWMEVTAFVETGSEWLPAGHVLTSNSLMNPELLHLIRQHADEKHVDPVHVYTDIVTSAVVSASSLPNLASTAAASAAEQSGSSSTPGLAPVDSAEGVDLLSPSPDITSSSASSSPRSRAEDKYSSSGSSSGGGSGSSSGSSANKVIHVKWRSGAWATVGIACGRILQWVRADGSLVITRPIDCCLWRAPTDNDRGGSTLSYFEQWKAAGLSMLERHYDSSSNKSKLAEEVDVITNCESFYDGSLEIMAEWILRPSRPSEAPAGHSIRCKATYLFMPSGAINVECSTFTPASLPPLPRVGLRFAVSGSISHARWLGLGPHEAYDDRNAACRLGSFESEVEALHVPYVFPQECGRRAEPRWVALREGSQGAGLMMIPNPIEADEERTRTGRAWLPEDPRDLSRWGWSASRHSLEALQAAGHDHELLEHVDSDKSVHVHIDSQTMGVGGYDSWSPNVDAACQVIPQGMAASAGITTRVLLLPLTDQQSELKIYQAYKRGDFLQRDDTV